MSEGQQWTEPPTRNAEYWWAAPRHQQLIVELLRNTPEDWGDDVAPESIVIDYVRGLEERVQALGGSLEKHADAVESLVDAPKRWRWLASTRELQRTAYGDTDYPKQGVALANSVMMNALALTNELHSEVLNEVGWKPWASDRGWVNREQYLKELVDCGHFLANLVIAVGCTDDEWEQRYRDKQALNARRQVDGYDGFVGKCHVCRRALDDGGIEQRENPRRPGTFEFVCAGCGAVQDAENSSATSRE